MRTRAVLNAPSSANSHVADIADAPPGVFLETTLSNTVANTGDRSCRQEGDQSGSRASTDASSLRDPRRKGAAARQHLVEHRTERPDVGALSTGLPAPARDAM